MHAQRSASQANCSLPLERPSVAAPGDPAPPSSPPMATATLPGRLRPQLTAGRTRPTTPKNHCARLVQAGGWPGQPPVSPHPCPRNVGMCSPPPCGLRDRSSRCATCRPKSLHRDFSSELPLLCCTARKEQDRPGLQRCHLFALGAGRAVT